MRNILLTIFLVTLTATGCRQRGGTVPQVGTEHGSGVSVPDKSTRVNEFNTDRNYGQPGKDPQAQYREVERTNSIPETRGTNPVHPTTSPLTSPGPKDAPDRP